METNVEKQPADFRKDLEYSNSDETKEKVKQALENIFGKNIEIIFEEKNMKAQNLYSCDVIVKLSNGKKITIDYKIQRHFYYTIFIEEKSKVEQKKDGWFYTSPANYVLWIWQDDSHEPYLMPLNDITRKAIERTIKNLKEHLVKNVGWTTSGKWVNISDIKTAINIAQREQEKITNWD